MGEDISQNSNASERFEGSVPVYRCVCGEMVPLHGETVSCPACGREYDTEVMRAATAETTEVSAGAASIDAMASDAESSDGLIGSHLGHFEILERIGGGGMGTVYRALDESLQRYVALKVLRQVEGASDLEVQRLFQEARAQARVNHPHVAHIYYVGTDSETPYLAMELVGRETLAHRMHRGPLPFQMIVRLGRQITSALQAAARFDIVHGDIKPANVLMVDEQTIKLSDFGLAYRLSESDPATGTTAGTPDYLPPEVTSGGKMDHYGDMYSLGVTLFAMTFRRLPYTPSSRSLSDRLRQHRDSSVEFPETWPSEIPQSWQAVLQRLLEKAPSDRYQNFQALLHDLNQHAPTSLPAASPLLRGLAWAVDCTLVGLPLVVLAILTSIQSNAVMTLLGVVGSAGICVGACFLQAVWGTTPGKNLFQIRIVDAHGLTPGKGVLASRAAVQFLWAWTFVIGWLAMLLPISYLAILFNAAVLLFMIADVGRLLFTEGTTIHDRVFGTRVVLDAKIAAQKGIADAA